MDSTKILLELSTNFRRFFIRWRLFKKSSLWIRQTKNWLKVIENKWGYVCPFSHPLFSLLWRTLSIPIFYLNILKIKFILVPSRTVIPVGKIPQKISSFVQFTSQKVIGPWNILTLWGPCMCVWHTYSQKEKKKIFFFWLITKDANIELSLTSKTLHLNSSQVLSVLQPSFFITFSIIPFFKKTL